MTMDIRHGPASPHHSGMAYRPEIDGLRALAVLPILLNHVNMRGFGGGYIGRAAIMKSAMTVVLI